MQEYENSINETQGFMNPDNVDVTKEKYYEDGPIQENPPIIKSIRFPIAGVCYYCALLSAVIMGLALLVTTILVGRSTIQSTGIMKYIETNIKTQLISDIQVVSSTSTCGEGYTSLNLAHWPGTQSGCYCKGIIFSDYIKTGTCSTKKKESNLNCWSVDSKNARDLTTFEGSAFCVKYLQNSTDYVYTSTCSSGYVSCGPYLCVRDDLSCPISSVTYSSTEPSTLPENSTSITLNGGAGYLILQNGYSSTPLLNLQVEFNGAPCLSAAQNPIKTTGEYYPLLKSKPTGCGTYGADTKSVLLTSESELDMYRENGVPVDSYLYLYSQYLDGGVAQLYARPRIELKQNSYCNSLDASMLENATGGASGIITSVYVCAIIMLVAVLIAGIATVVVKAKSPEKTFSIDRIGRAMRWPSLLVVLGFLIINIVMTALASSNTNKLQSQSAALQELSDANCFMDSAINQGATDFLSVPGKTIGIYYAAIVSLIFSIGSFVVVLVVSLINLNTYGLKLVEDDF